MRRKEDPNDKLNELMKIYKEERSKSKLLHEKEKKNYKKKK